MVGLDTYLMSILVDAYETLRTSGADSVTNESRVLVTTILLVPSR
jgi:hypothetical protein